MLDYIIIGAAQAGLSMAYRLKKLGKSFILVDGGNKIGESWLNRWDSLTLFTPTEFNHLEGLEFQKPKGYYPNKYDVANYFDEYVRLFDFKIHFNTLIENITKKEGVFNLKHKKGIYQCKNVIIATGPFHTPYIPPFHKNIDISIHQLHSNFYSSTSQLTEGNTLVVGAGDSGYQILDEISANFKDKNVYFSGNTSVKTLPQVFLGKTLWWWFTKTGFLSFNKHSMIGKIISNFPQPIIGTNTKEILSRKNVKALGKTLNAEKKSIYFENGEVKDIKNIIWATGYRPNFNWIDGLELDENNYPKNNRGVSNIKGLYFIGLPWLHTRGSATLGGVKKDAKYISDYISNLPS